MGYELPDEELARCFEEFKVLCDKKKNVTDQDILAIVTHSTTTDEAEVDGYKLMWFAVHTSNMTTSTSVVRLELDGQQFEAVCSGDGPVDAAFEAIDQIIRPVEHSFDLYRINSISPARTPWATCRSSSAATTARSPGAGCTPTSSKHPCAPTSAP